MKCKIPEISWHNRDPVLSVDIQPNSGAAGGFYRLASGGTDSHVLIWYVNSIQNGSELELEVAADLTRHQRAVNVVKWSPNGKLLASGDDESVIFIWKQKAESEVNIMDTTSDQDKEIWITLKVLRGHMEDVYDLSWCPNSLFLVSGSVDNSAIIWDVHKGKSQAILNDHKGFVQGVAWDPKNQIIATLSTDRYMRIFDIQSKKVLHRVSKSSLPVPEGNELYGKRMRIYHDDTLQTFFRRLCFTPDGKLLITPAGVTDYEGVTHPIHTSYIYSRFMLKQPAIVLPCPDQYTVAIKCCPLLFKLRPHNPETNPPVIPLPYRMIFAIATKSSVYLYDTQQKQPFGLISNIHYTRLTDVTWSSDGCIIVVSSTDGFCSLITFDPGELGEEYEDSAEILTKMVAEKPIKEKKSKKNKDVDAQGSKGSGTNRELVRKSSADSDKSKEETTSICSENEKKVESKKEDAQKPTPIAFRRKRDLDKEIPKPEEKVETKNTIENPNSNKTQANTNAENSSEKKETNDGILSTSKVIRSDGIAAEIIIDKEILSSEEKFESPEKKSRPATPISVRRHPRTPSSTVNSPSVKATPSSSILNVKSTQSSDNSPISSVKQVSSPRNAKRATPIAVRRTPRALITTPSIIDKSSIVEEAMDAWPIDQEPPKGENNKNSVKPDKSPVVQKECAIHLETTTDRTEDIRLVYEDTIEEALRKEASAEAVEKKQETEQDKTEAASVPNTPKQTSNNRTPRRVELKTISTPKSKKKLLD